MQKKFNTQASAPAPAPSSSDHRRQRALAIKRDSVMPGLTRSILLDTLRRNGAMKRDRNGITPVFAKQGDHTTWLGNKKYWCKSIYGCGESFDTSLAAASHTRVCVSGIHPSHLRCGRCRFVGAEATSLDTHLGRVHATNSIYYVCHITPEMEADAGENVAGCGCPPNKSMIFTSPVRYFNHVNAFFSRLSDEVYTHICLNKVDCDHPTRLFSDPADHARCGRRVGAFLFNPDDPECAIPIRTRKRTRKRTPKPAPVCDVCGKNDFTTAHMFRQHKRRKHGTGQHSRFVCGIDGCVKSCARADNLKDHRKRIHGT